MTAHVFLSYVRENATQVERLAADLDAAGVKTWLDRKDLAPGERWKEAIRTAIRGGDLFVACFSRAFAARERSHMNEELTLAIEDLRLRPTDRAWFIPVLLDDTEVPDRLISAGESLRDLQWVDLANNWQDGIASIVAVAHQPTREWTHEIGREFAAYGLGAFVTDFPELLEVQHGLNVTRFEVEVEARRTTDDPKTYCVISLHWVCSDEPCADKAIEYRLSARKAGSWEVVKLGVTRFPVERAWLNYSGWGESIERELVEIKRARVTISYRVEKTLPRANPGQLGSTAVAPVLPEAAIAADRVAPYHTESPQYLPTHGNLYHDNSNCRIGNEIQPHYRLSGTGGKPRCSLCSILARNEPAG